MLIYYSLIISIYRMIVNYPHMNEGEFLPQFLKIPTQTSQSAWGPQKKEPQKHNFCGLHLFILYFPSYSIRTDAQGKNMAKSWQDYGIDKTHRACSVTKPESSRINRFAQICHLVYFFVVYCKIVLAFWREMCYYNYRR